MTNGDVEMTLREFLFATTDTPPRRLRHAMVSALSVEPARVPEAYPRFYARVLETLERLPDCPCESRTADPEHRAA